MGQAVFQALLDLPLVSFWLFNSRYRPRL